MIVLIVYLRAVRGSPVAPENKEASAPHEPSF